MRLYYLVRLGTLCVIGGVLAWQSSRANIVDQQKAISTPFRHEEPLLGRRCRDVVDTSLKTAVGDANLHLNACGFVKLERALPVDSINLIHQAFLKLEKKPRAKLYLHAPLRERRVQYTLPFEAPFNDPTVFANQHVLDVVKTYLGADFALDLVTVVVAAANADMQKYHRDTQSLGSITVQIALHPLDRSFAPLSLCGGTHNMTEEGVNAVSEKVLKAVFPAVLNGILAQEDAHLVLRKAICKDMVLAAPMAVGDLTIYDSMLVHWGSANRKASPRYLLHITYKNSTEHPGVHGDFFPNASKQARFAIQTFQDAFRQGLDHWNNESGSLLTSLDAEDDQTHATSTSCARQGSHP